METATKTQTAIINRGMIFGSLNGVLTPNAQVLSIVNKHIKQGTAKLVCDTEDTLMYKLGA
jgi:hypothetical protein